MEKDPWSDLKTYTQARIALGRVGSSLPTKELLNFSAAHAQARDAVFTELDKSVLEQMTLEFGIPVLQLKSEASDRDTYLKRPDFGRKLDEASIEKLRGEKKKQTVTLVIGDGLSAEAINKNIIPFLQEFLPLCNLYGWGILSFYVVENARVAISDEIGGILESQVSVILIGERPGLSAPDSMGIYLTFAPNAGNTDEKRNCISNIRKQGLDYTFAAHKLAYLLNESLKRKLSGVILKDDYTLELFYQEHKFLDDKSI